MIIIFLHSNQKKYNSNSEALQISEMLYLCKKTNQNEQKSNPYDSGRLGKFS